MTEKIEGVVTPEGTEQPPVAPADVSPEGDQPLSQRSDEVSELKSHVEQLSSEIRGLQSRQDKSENRFDKRIKELGIELTPEQLQQSRMLDLEEQVQQLAQPQAAPASAPPVADPKIAEVMEELGITDPTPDMQAAALKNVDSPIKMAAELVRLQSNKPAPSPANAVSPGGGDAPPPVPNLQKATQRLAEIKEQYPNRRDWPSDIKEEVKEIKNTMDEAFTK